MSTRTSTISNKHAKKQFAPRVSIIICTYNRKNIVLTALAYLRRQTLAYSQFEVIVVDNGSSDGTLGAVQAYVNAGPLDQKRLEDRWRVRTINEPRNGLANARDTGLRLASGDIAVFLDDDTLAEPAYLEELLKTYDETGADAVGGRVELRWEATRPYWLTDDLLDILGYFAPARVRTPLPMAMTFSSNAFSVRMSALRAVGCFSPLLNKRRVVPVTMEMADLCQRLRAAGYSLWYTPDAVVTHRVPQARLARPFFIRRAYWQGRSEVLAHYAQTNQEHQQRQLTDPATLDALTTDLLDIAQTALLERPLLFLAGKPTNERLDAAMAQARLWGHIRQQIQCIEHAPAQAHSPAVLFVHPASTQSVSASLLINALETQGIRFSTSIEDIPVAWLWQHRAYNIEPIGILHFYAPGAFHLTPGKQQRLWFLIRFARSLGIQIVISDVGGWWQSAQDIYSLPRRVFERSLIRHSNVIFTHTRQPEQLYPDKYIGRRVRCYPHAGYLGSYPSPLPRSESWRRLGLPSNTRYVYLCLAPYHNERELLFLLEAFRASQQTDTQVGLASDSQTVHLLIVGKPQDKHRALIQQASHIGNVHLFLEQELAATAMQSYLGASNTIVLPHFSQHMAGTLEPAMLALSYERTAVVPDLPRFRGMLFPRASMLYTAGSQASFTQALRAIQSKEFQLRAKDKKMFLAEDSWSEYARRVTEVYKQLLNKTSL